MQIKLAKSWTDENGVKFEKGFVMNKPSTKAFKMIAAGIAKRIDTPDDDTVLAAYYKEENEDEAPPAKVSAKKK